MVVSIAEFVVLGKTARGAAAAELVRQALESPGLYQFAEIRELKGVQELETTEHRKAKRLLEVFAYGTLADYRQMESEVGPLSPRQLTKLKHLTLVSLSYANKILPYAQLAEALQAASVRELEDLILDAIYCSVVKGKLDQRNALFEVEFAISRDLRDQDLQQMIRFLTSWSASAAALVHQIDSKIAFLNQQHEQHRQEAAAHETLVQQQRQLCQEEQLAMDTSRSEMEYNSQEYIQEEERSTRHRKHANLR